MRNYKCADCNKRKFKSRLVSRYGRRRVIRQTCKFCMGHKLVEREHYD